jgi:hypothetical protein
VDLDTIVIGKMQTYPPAEVHADAKRHTEREKRHAKAENPR